MRIISLLALFAAATSVACLDMPITRLEKTSNPVGTADASSDVVDGPQEACRRCLPAPEDPGPGCSEPYTECINDPKCALIIACGFESECFQGSRRGFLGCGLPCVKKYAPTPDDPVLIVASKLFSCLANGPCGDICFSSE